MEKAVVLLSGGLDSTTCMAVAKEQGKELYPISFDYHQRHSIELEGAKKIAAFYKVNRHLIIETNMETIGGSALTDDSIAVPEGDVSRTSVPVRRHRRQQRRLFGLSRLPSRIYPAFSGRRGLLDGSGLRRKAHRDRHAPAEFVQSRYRALGDASCRAVGAYAQLLQRR